jgi:ribosomal protein S18 acetylase RimI-like enzyme
VTGHLRIEEVSASSEGLLAAVRELTGQLSTSAQPPTAAHLEEIITSPASRLLIARNDGDDILGMLTLILFRTPTGLRTWIEDVVVNEAARGLGVARLLVGEAVAQARRAGARTIDLTSRPDREAANALYLRLGFTLHDTNLYRITL